MKIFINKMENEMQQTSNLVQNASPTKILIPKKSRNNHIHKWKYLLEDDENFYGGKKLRVTGKDLRTLDKDIFKLKIFLTRLDLSPDYQSCLNYKLGTLPKNIGNLVHLRELKLDTNDLRELPEEVGKLHNLERLSLSNNFLSNLPDTLINLKNLKCLHLTNNNFEEIPECIYELSITSLDFTSNKLKRLDRRLAELNKTLRILSVYDNAIIELEPWIKELNELDQFWFGQNRIKVLPREITMIEKIDWAVNGYFSIIFENNPIEKPPLDICMEGFSAIQQWYDNQWNPS